MNKPLANKDVTYCTNIKCKQRKDCFRNLDNTSMIKMIIIGLVILQKNIVLKVMLKSVKNDFLGKKSKFIHNEKE